MNSLNPHSLQGTAAGTTSGTALPLQVQETQRHSRQWHLVKKNVLQASANILQNGCFGTACAQPLEPCVGSLTTGTKIWIKCSL